MVNQDQLRRDVIKGIVGAGTIGIAGCLGDDDDDDDDDDGDDIEADDTTDDDNGDDTAEDSPTWIFGTSRDGSAFFTTGQAIQAVTRDHTDSVSISAQASDGTEANIYAIADGDYDLVGSNTNTYQYAHEGTETFADAEVDASVGQQGPSLWRAEYGMVQLADDDMESWSDMDGRTIATVPSGFSAAPQFDIVFDELGIDPEVRDLEVGDYAAALGSRVDAVSLYTFNMGASTTGELQQVAQENEIKPIPMTEDEKNIIGDAGIPVDTVEVDEEFVPELSDGYDLHTMGATINFHEDLDVDLVETVVNIWIDNSQDIRDAVDLAWDMSEEENFVDGIFSEYPVHPGVENVIDERGWSIE